MIWLSPSATTTWRQPVGYTGAQLVSTICIFFPQPCYMPSSSWWFWFNYYVKVWRNSPVSIELDKGRKGSVWFPGCPLRIFIYHIRQALGSSQWRSFTTRTCT